MCIVLLQLDFWPPSPSFPPPLWTQKSPPSCEGEQCNNDEPSCQPKGMTVFVEKPHSIPAAAISAFPSLACISEFSSSNSFIFASSLVVKSCFIHNMPEGPFKVPQTSIMSTTYFYFFTLTTIELMILWLCLRARYGKKHNSKDGNVFNRR